MSQLRPRQRRLVIALRAVLWSGAAFAATASSVPATPPVIELRDVDGRNGFRIDGQNAFDTLGFGVGGIGDVNGDGFDDLAFGAGQFSEVAFDAGAAYVIFGRGVRSFVSPFDLDTLDGTNGFRLEGVAEDDNAGVSVARAGDVNGDGTDDFMIGAYGTDFNGERSGSTYVVFGRAGGGFPAVVSLGAIDGSNGFRIDGAAELDRSGFTAAPLGDFNGDGRDDVIVGSFGATPNGPDSGASYVVFGRAGTPFPAVLDVADLDGTNGFRLEGAAAGDYSGAILSSAGDFNGDGMKDLIIGAYDADPNGTSSGSSYIVFGSTMAFPPSLDLGDLDGSNGIRLDGAAEGDASGYSVAGIGDFNGDGIDDVVIGADGADPGGSDAGSAYIVFGRTGPLPATLPLAGLDGTDGFRLDGVAAGDRTGRTSWGLGDTNGDGLDDVVIGAERADPNGPLSGSVYVVQGRRGPQPAVRSLGTLDGTDGFRLHGEAAGDRAGGAVAAAGDLDSDGLADIVIGAVLAASPASYSGSVYVVYGEEQAQFADGFE